MTTHKANPKLLKITKGKDQLIVQPTYTIVKLLSLSSN